MVLESFINPLKAEEHPKRMFFYGLLYATIGIFLSQWIFYDYASLVMVFFTTFAAVPLIYNIIKFEEKKDLKNLNEKNLLKEHSKALKVFMFYFFGTTIAFAFWYIILKPETISSIFSIQTETLTTIRSSVTGKAFSSQQIFFDILTNNLKVLIFCVLFSFLYGVGAIFILTWNASVIGVAIGDTIKTEIFHISQELNLNTGIEYLSIFSYGILRYTIHGIPEILSYFVAGLAGGIISIAAIRHDFGTDKFEKIVLDSSTLLLISLVLVVVSAFLEVYVTPVFF